MVRHAFRVLTEDKIKTRLIAFSDDMDGLRKVPDNVPNKEMLDSISASRSPRCAIRSARMTSFGEHNNARLRAFLDHFGFDYEFMSSTDCYKSGRFDEALLEDAGAARQGDGDHAAVACARSAPRPIRRSCRSIRRPAWCCRCR